LAEIHAALGDYDKSFEWLERAEFQRSPRLSWLCMDSLLKPLRGDERFRALLSRLRLPQKPLEAAEAHAV
jgi:hypothetical protein